MNPNGHLNEWWKWKNVVNKNEIWIRMVKYHEPKGYKHNVHHKNPRFLLTKRMTIPLVATCFVKFHHGLGEKSSPKVLVDLNPCGAFDALR